MKPPRNPLIPTGAQLLSGLAAVALISGAALAVDGYRTAAASLIVAATAWLFWSNARKGYHSETGPK